MASPASTLDLVQFAVLFVLAAMNGTIAYSVFRIQRERNTPRMIVYVDTVEEDERVFQGLYIQNVGLVPALHVRTVVEVEEWRDGQLVQSRFHDEGFDAFQDGQVSLSPQEHRLYELPSIEGWSLIVRAVVSCKNGPGDSTRFALGDDPAAVQEVMFGTGRVKLLKRLRSRLSTNGQKVVDLRMVMGLNSLKNYGELFGDRGTTQEP